MGNSLLVLKPGNRPNSQFQAINSGRPLTDPAGGSRDGGRGNACGGRS
jgi:hypothetical protein